MSMIFVNVCSGEQRDYTTSTRFTHKFAKKVSIRIAIYFDSIACQAIFSPFTLENKFTCN